MHGWFIYMVRRDDGSLYTGITTDVRRRLIQNKRGGKYGSKYLRGHTPLKLVLRRKIGGKGLALKVEIAIKKMPKTEKETIVKNKKYLDRIIRSIVQL